MSSDDPTKKYPPPEDYLTHNNLEELLTAVVRKVMTQEFLPQMNARFDLLEAEIREIKAEQKEMRRDFRNYRREITRDLTELEDRVDALENPPRT